MPQLKTLPTPQTWNAVLGFDFDDTLVDHSHGSFLDPEFFECIRWIRVNYGAAWGICTGRSLYQLIEGFNETKFPFLPDYVVVREREIFTPGQFGRWTPDDSWNGKCEKEHLKLFRKAKRQLGKIQKFVEKETQGRWVSVEGDAAGIVASSESEMDEILAMIQTLKTPPNLTYERNRIYLRFSHRDFNKGTCLLEVAQRWGQKADTILAVGDNFNDLSMLQPDVSHSCGCPANAVSEVQQWVAGRGGVVAKQNASKGVMEVLGHYFQPKD